MNKVALITGASRGIGKEIAVSLAQKGYNIVLAAKSTEENPKLPGTIYSVAKEIESYNVKALPIKTDLRNIEDIDNLVNETSKNMGRLDVLVNNAGALWWQPINNTNIKKYDLINDINSRATFCLSSKCIELMRDNDGGHIIMQSPPLLTDYEQYKLILKNKTAYMISKWGMTMTALGISEEYKNKGIAANTLWPYKPIKTHALINNNVGNEKMWRKPDILVDSVNEIIKEDPNIFTGNQLIDELYLREKGYTDFEKYQSVSGFEPPLLNSLKL